MFFEKKIKHLVNVEKAEKTFREKMQDEKLEKKDVLAMIIAACIVYVPAFLIVCSVFIFFIWLFFLRFT